MGEGAAITMMVAFVYLDRGEIDYSSTQQAVIREKFSSRAETEERVNFLLSNGYQVISNIPDYLVLSRPVNIEESSDGIR